jgi:hypothetical protein
VENATEDDIVAAMEKETGNWLGQYPIPLFVSAFDNKGDLYDLSDIKTCNHLTGFFDQDGKIRLYWRLLKDEEIPDVALNQGYVDKLYSGVAFKTSAEFDGDRRKKRRQIRLGWLVFFIWLAVIPAIFAILEYSSSLLSLFALIYSLYKATQKALELTGRWPNSKREKKREREEQLKNHYYFHCQMNPEGFRRLKLENLEKMAKDEIAKEAESLGTAQGEA